MSLAGKVAVIVGGGRGIGAAAARQLAADGATVVVSYLRDLASAEALRSEILRAGGRAEIRQSDIHDSDAMARLIAAAHDLAGRLDIVVASAPGHGAVFTPLLEQNWETFSAFSTSKLKSDYTLARAVIPLMSARAWGRLIFVSSSWATHPNMCGLTAMSPGFAAEFGFVKALAVELGRTGITVNAVVPGMVDTDLAARMPAGTRERVANVTPLGRIALPEDIAGVIAFLASEGSRFMTGACVQVSGGLVMD